MAELEMADAKERIESISEELKILLLPQDPNDDKTLSLKSAAARAAMKRRCLQEVCSACTACMRKRTAGKRK